ncbi:MAG TPA: hypothetical protein VJR69_07895 [Nitrospira sp.]|nr:hypothetical protein [Nitrospira sp.]
MLGIRQPLHGRYLKNWNTHNTYWCWHAMLDHFERGLGMSDAQIEPFKGLIEY